MSKPRQLTTPQFYIICPAESPEGQAVGLTKNLAYLTYISLGDFSESFIDLVYKYGTKPILECTRFERAYWYKVFVHGKT
jgi:DNA-directed RNA polymerase II subunit RPB2